MSTVAIHQPNFFPWLGYFDKIVRADAFVLLDHVQFQKTGGTWTNRVKLLVGGQARWITAPVVRIYHGVRRTDEMTFHEAIPWRIKMLKTLAANYRRAKYYDECMTLLEPLILHKDARAAEYNIHAIGTIIAAFGMDRTRLLRSSEMAVSGQGSELLLAITIAAGGTTYLCGGGATGYQDDGLFAERGVALVYQDFRHPKYPQVEKDSTNFVAGLSIIDALMNCGITGTRELLHGGIR
jgi:WbqC-like protein family